MLLKDNIQRLGNDEYGAPIGGPSGNRSPAPRSAVGRVPNWPHNDEAVYKSDQSKMAGTAKKTDLGLLEEDDEFEEFPAEGI